MHEYPSRGYPVQMKDKKVVTSKEESLWTPERKQRAARAVALAPDRLQEECSRLPNDLYDWFGDLADANKRLLDTKLAREVEEARLTMFCLRQAEEGGEKSPAEWKVEARVRASEQWEALRQAEIRAETERERVWGVVNSLRAKKMMLAMMLGVPTRGGDVDDDAGLAETRTTLRDKIARGR